MNAEKPRLSDYLKTGRYPWSEAYQEVMDNHDRCIVCGKRVGANAIWVVLGEGGDVLIAPENDEDAMATDSGYMGWWPVGPECGRTVPAEYRAARATG